MGAEATGQTGVAGEELVELRLLLGAGLAHDHSSEVASQDVSRTRTNACGFRRPRQLTRSGRGGALASEHNSA
jgi:hypothetical protein